MDIIKTLAEELKSRGQLEATVKLIDGEYHPFIALHYRKETTGS